MVKVQIELIIGPLNIVIMRSLTSSRSNTQFNAEEADKTVSVLFRGTSDSDEMPNTNAQQKYCETWVSLLKGNRRGFKQL